MTLTNTPQGPAKDSTEKVWRLGGSLHHQTVQQFTVREWWHTPISSLGFTALGVFFSIGVTGTLASFPWDDSTVVQRLIIELFVSPLSFFTFWMFVAAIATWTDPHKLKFDDNGDLILQSVLRRQRAAIRDIKTVLLTKQDDDERGDDALGIRVKFSGSKLRLCRFAERDEFMKALKAANPVIVVKFD
jgi:hypothetical protein